MEPHRVQLWSRPGRRPVGGIVVALFLVAACANASSDSPAAASRSTAPAIEPIAPVTPSSQAETAPTSMPVTPTIPARGWYMSSANKALSLVGTTGEVGLVDPAAGTVTRLRDQSWSRRVSLDGSYAVSTVLVGSGDTKVAWDRLPTGDELGTISLPGDDYQATATQIEGTITAFVDAAAPVKEGEVAGAHAQSTIVLASPTGEHWRTTLDGNFMPEAFSSATDAAGLPSQVYLLEYIPAEAPTFYRVRVLTTATGEVELPVNLRLKTEQVDERMSGVSRSQVVASDEGLLFTLYRGTIDGTPEGEPYAFVHTLDFEGGVWCLDVHPSLELDVLPGSLAVGGDRLYVASANGMVGSFPIPSITNPELSPAMDWTNRVSTGGSEAPPIVAGDLGAILVTPRMGTELTDVLTHVLSNGDLGPVLRTIPTTSALALDDSGDVIAVGDGWSTIDVAEVPEWLGQVTRIVVP